MAAIAAFARDVADAARAGDPLAATIWSDAARELAATARAAAGALPGPAALAYSGGLFAAGELLLAPLRAELPDLRPPLGVPLDGAARLLERPALFRDLIFEAP